MAEKVDFALRARDEASAAIARVGKNLGGLTSNVSALAAASGPLRGIGSALALGPQAAGIAAVTAGIAAAALAVRSLVAEMQKMGAAAEQVRNLAQVTGIAASEVQGLRKAFADAGIAGEVLNVGVRFLNKNIREGDESLKALGITTHNTRDALFQLSDVFAAMPDGPEKSGLAIALLGRAGTELIPVMNKGSQALRDFIAANIATGTSLRDDMIPVLTQIDDSFDSINRSVEGLKNTLTVALAPAVVTVVAGLDEFLKRVLILPELLKVVVLAMAATSNSTLLVSAAVLGLNDVLAIAAMSNSAFREKFLKPGDLAAVSAAVLELKDKIIALRLGMEKPGVTVFEMMREQGGLTKDMLVALSKQSDEFLKAIGTSAEAINAALVGIGLGAKKTAEGLSIAAVIVRDVLRGTQESLANALRLIEVLDSRPPQPRITPTPDLTKGLPTDKDLEMIAGALRKVREEQEELFRLTNIQGAADQMRGILSEMLAPAILFKETFLNIWSAMEQSLASSLASIVAHTQNFKGAMTQLWRAIKDAIIQQIAVIIARIVAMMILLPVLTAVFTAIFGPGAAPIVKAAVLGTGATEQGATDRASRPSLPALQNVTNITNVYSYDLRDGVADRQSPRGTLRRSSERLAIIGAY